MTGVQLSCTVQKQQLSWNLNKGIKMSKEKSRLRINPFGSIMLIVVIAAAAGGGWIGKEYMRKQICGDIAFYRSNDKDLVGTRDCVGIIDFKEGN